MASAHVSFPAGDRPALTVTTGSGQLRVVAEERSDVVVSGDAGAELETVAGRPRVKVTGGSGRVEVRCPVGADVLAGSRTGQVELRGYLGEVRATTETGAITVERGTSVDVRAGTGQVVVEACDGACCVQTHTGQVRVGRADAVDIAADTGSVTVGPAREARIRTGSGTLALDLERGGRAEVHSHTGSVRVTVPPGVHPATSLRTRTGPVRCECETGDDAHIVVTLTTGSIVVSER